MLLYPLFLSTFHLCCLVRLQVNILLLWLCAASSPDGHRLAVLVEASSAAVDVGVGGRRHWLLPGPDGLGCGEDEKDHGCGSILQSQTV